MYRRAWVEQQMHSDLAEFLEWLQSVDALAERAGAEGRLELALGWHDYMSHSCPACDVLSKSQVAKKSQSRRLAASVRIHLNSWTSFFPLLLGSFSSTVV